MDSCAWVEGRSIGKIDKETYKIYLRAWGALYILPILMLLLAIMERSVYGLQNWWLSVWSNANAAALVHLFLCTTCFYLEFTCTPTKDLHDAQSLPFCFLSIQKDCCWLRVLHFVFKHMVVS